MNLSGLRTHVFITYTSLRFGLGLLALALPLVLWLGGRLVYHVPIQGSFCAYYHTPMRDVFVGTLFAVGAFLYLYKGFTWQENVALNVAGVMAVLVALVPMSAPVEGAVRLPLREWARNDLLHQAFSILFMLSIAYVCIFRASDTLDLVRSATLYRFYSVSYKLLGACMIAAPGVTFWLAKRYQGHLDPNKMWITFAVETAAVWTFGTYWLLKSKEMRESQADREVVKAA